MRLPYLAIGFFVFDKYFNMSCSVRAFSSRHGLPNCQHDGGKRVRHGGRMETRAITLFKTVEASSTGRTLRLFIIQYLTRTILEPCTIHFDQQETRLYLPDTKYNFFSIPY